MAGQDFRLGLPQEDLQQQEVSRSPSNEEKERARSKSAHKDNPIKRLYPDCGKGCMRQPLVRCIGNQF